MRVKIIPHLVLSFFACYITCEAGCPKLSSPDHGSVQYHAQGHFASFMCEHGYVLNGSITTVCLFDKWSAEAPQCLPVREVLMNILVLKPQTNLTSCEFKEPSDEASHSMPQHTTDATTTAQETHVTSVHTSEETLHPQGASPARRSHTPRSVTVPTDVSHGSRISIGCEIPSSFPNGYLSLSRKYPHRVQYMCAGGFTLEGTHTAYCYSGTWSSPVPVCIPLEGQPHAPQPPTGENPCLIDYDGCDQVCTYGGYTKAVCQCYNGYKHHGKKCLSLDDTRNHSSSSCSSSGCSHGCSENGGIARCYCPRGYTLDNDGKTCRDVDECMSDKGGCQDICINYEGSHRCDCRRGYKLDTDGRSCIQEPSLPLPTQNPCHFYNGGCSQGCENKNGAVKCYCWTGYTLSDDSRACHKVSVPDPCSSNNGLRPCGDICVNLGNRTHRCECRQPGTQLHQDGRSCVDINECDENNFGCMHYCYNTVGSALCYCKPGFKLDINNKTCSDIDECSLPGIESHCYGQCVNTMGSFRCVPAAAQYATTTASTRDETTVTKDAEKPDGEIIFPGNEPTPEPTVPVPTSRPVSTCEDGFEHDAHGRCVDVNECRTGELRCSQHCVNTQGSVYCTCDRGYALAADGMTCVDIDECAKLPYPCDQGCVNTMGSYVCTCWTGFELSSADGHSCTDIDECVNNNGGCERDCVNIPGGHFCTCPKGSKISSDLRSCVGVTCPAFVEVANGITKCVPEIEKGKFARVGTVCNSRCAKGYGREGTPRNECLENGTWRHAFPSCSAKYCPPLKNPEHGRVLPERCLSDAGNVVSSRCTYTCDEGFILSGKIVNTCKRTATWKHEPPTCKRRRSEVSITCPQDVHAVLPSGSDHGRVELPRPVSTNVDADNIVVHPGYLKDYKGDFHFGSHTVTYVARDPETGREASCTFVVEILDKEPPNILSCPGSVHVYATRLEGAVVRWEEPEFEDNVDVDVVKKSKEPGTVFPVGEHFVQYVAYDTSGNRVTCEFAVIVQSKQCGWLRDIENGHPDCNDWLYGVVCEPYCYSGFGFPRNVPTVYACNLSGIWEPRSWIPECSPIQPTSSTSCMPGSEYFDELEDEANVCLECPPGMFWEAGTSMCSFCEEGFYQDEFGQTHCKPCPSSFTSATSQLIKEQCGA
ncbi:sushi, von Willebrand factor type A, EGF and pentraxin domain-containing protein 1-like isoform X2 [Ornithodoros turicata]|uniref:sushi, von Willebrand factor type A, EGF and pentraxin domain-containing protein 1-like isoform X2 n=1 Tax=Ornithodoros turicata TaxID=34597 RepID=UPI0031391C61